MKYLKSAKYDFTFFFSPLIFVVIFSVIIKSFFPELLNIKTDPIWLFIFIIIFDVAHVWGTLYMVYFNKIVFNRNKKLYLITPLISFLFGLILMLFDLSGTILFFIIGFFAVYHFIKQQVGFILLYGNKEENINRADRLMDKIIGWSITGFPMLYWFSNLDTRNYIWFMEGEFIKLPSTLFPALWIIFILIILVYFIYESIRKFNGKNVNSLKYLYIFTTFFIWFNGIVWNNSLLIFAFGNVLLHGLNYIGIVYLSTTNKINSNEYETSKFIKKIAKFSFFSFIGLLIIIAIIEEYLWDQFFRFEVASLWGNTFYNFATNLPDIILAIIVGILIVPQLTHYYLDGYIWRKNYNPKI